MTPAPRPACHVHLPSDDFRAATPSDASEIQPCRYCFPDGRVDVSVDQLVVSAVHAGRLHRDESTGRYVQETHDGGTDLADRLDAMDFEDLPRAGGDA